MTHRAANSFLALSIPSPSARVATALQPHPHAHTCGPFRGRDTPHMLASCTHTGRTVCVAQALPVMHTHDSTACEAVQHDGSPLIVPSQFTRHETWRIGLSSRDHRYSPPPLFHLTNHKHKHIELMCSITQHQAASHRLATCSLERLHQALAVSQSHL